MKVLDFSFFSFFGTLYSSTVILFGKDSDRLKVAQKRCLGIKIVLCRNGLLACKLSKNNRYDIITITAKPIKLLIDDIHMEKNHCKLWTNCTFAK